MISPVAEITKFLCNAGEGVVAEATESRTGPDYRQPLRIIRRKDDGLIAFKRRHKSCGTYKRVRVS